MNLQEFQTKVYPLKNKLFRFAKRLLDHTEEAEDVVQEVFIKLWKRRDLLDDYRNVEALAMVSVKNLCLDKIKTKRFTVVNFEDHRGFLENLSDEQQPDHDDLISGIHRAIKMLPEQQQMIIHLRDIEGCAFEDIAEIVEMNENAIRVALSRARKRVREIIANMNKYEYQGN
ncbi:MAG: RNA polymerase sigma factor [Bacteroidales bacterium]|jgi:RNA polymerase sigma-70 factor (ECF subfamily)|nr:RNA polymerase sigma factor [Bacteroidales bacterium]